MYRPRIDYIRPPKGEDAIGYYAKQAASLTKPNSYANVDSMRDENQITAKEDELARMRETWKKASPAYRSFLETQAQIIKADIQLLQQRIVRRRRIQEQRSLSFALGDKA